MPPKISLGIIKNAAQNQSWNLPTSLNWSPWPCSDAARGRLEGERGVVEEVGEQPDVVLRLAAHLDRVQHLKQQSKLSLNQFCFANKN